MTGLEGIIDIEPGTPIILSSDHNWAQVCGLYVKTTKKHVTLEMEYEGTKKSPRKRYRLSDFVNYEVLEVDENETRKPRRKDIVLFTTQEGKGCGYVNEINDSRIEFQMASPNNILTMHLVPLMTWLRVGDGPSKEYSWKDIKEYTVLKRWNHHQKIDMG